VYDVSNIAQNTIRSILSVSYEDYFQGKPETDTREHFLVQKIKGSSDNLSHFRRKYIVCPDRYLREPSRAVQEHLINIGYISDSSDCCTNIPWRFFISQGENAKPFDFRVKRILSYLSDYGISTADVFAAFRGWDGTGAPDLIDFGNELKCIEVKFLGDQLKKHQVIFHEIARSLNIKVSILEFQNVFEPNLRSVGCPQKPSAREFKHFWSTKLGLKVSEFVDSHLKSTNVPIVSNNPWVVRSRRNGLTDLNSFKTAPTALVNTFLLCLRYENDKCEIIFSEDEIAEISRQLYHAGSMKWWIVPLVLSRWINFGPIKDDYINLIDVALDWEATFRTIFWEGRPKKDHFKKTLGFRSKPITLGLEKSKVAQIYKECKRGTPVKSAEHLKFFDYLLNITDNSEISLRDQSSLN
jgi:hypothetical protein